MNVQIYGKAKCFDTKKAQRYFRERSIGFQNVDILLKGLSKRELQSVAQAVGGIDNLVSEKAEGYHLFIHLTPEGKQEKLLEDFDLYITPIVRNGAEATVGYKPEVWKTWK